MKQFSILLCFFTISLTHAYATNYFWVGGSGNWNDYSNHWATSSGGSTFQTIPPTVNDDVYFDSNSFSSANDILLINNPAFCRNFNFNNNSNAEIAADSINRKLTINGDLTISVPFNFSFHGILEFTSNCQMTSAFTPLHCLLSFIGPGSNIFLHDSINSLNEIRVFNANFYSQNNSIYVKDFSFLGNINNYVNMGNSEIHVTGNVDGLNAPTTVFDLDSTIIYLSSDGSLESLTGNVNKVFVDAAGNSSNTIHFLTIDTLIYYSSNQLYLISDDINYMSINGVSGSINSISLGQGAFINFIDARNDSSQLVQFGFGEYSYGVGKLIAAQNISIDGSTSDDGITFQIDSLICSKDVSFSNYFAVEDFFQMSLEVNYLDVGMNGDYSFINCHHLITHPNSSHLFQVGLNQIIDTLEATGSFGQEIVFNSDFSGSAADIIINKDFCGDYLSIQDMNVSGGAAYYAGGNSQDVSNNSGWFFSACSNAIDEEIANDDLLLFPNPANSLIFLNQKVEQIKVFSLNGTLISAYENKQKIDVSNFAKGIYVFEVKNESKVSHQKIILN